MMKDLISLAAVLLLSHMLLANSVADQSISRGAAVANACAACHGPDGQSQGAIPSIAPLSSEILVEALRAFRAGARQGTVMNRIAKGLDDADLEALAAYFATSHAPIGFLSPGGGKEPTNAQ
jgi:sulfide dehydrogenase cytochrome subunit